MYKNIVRILCAILLMVSCKSEEVKKKNESSFGNQVVAKEIIQVSGYTYLRSEVDGKELWLAAPSFAGKVGETYYYNDGLEMFQFRSKELNRTFKSILFLQNIYDNPKGEKIAQPKATKKITNQQKDLKIEKIDGVTTVAELFSDLEKYKGKKVVVKGKVTKFNPMIMNKNWIHLEDGTDFKGEYDLILTSQQEFTVGDIVTLEGIVATNIDLGYGYKYKLLLEDVVKLIDL